MYNDNTMITRSIQKTLVDLSAKFSVVTISGPRQSGKTTLCKMTFPGKNYTSLEYPDIREFAIRDPRGFLRQYPDGAVMDEIQNAPDLISYIQGEVDRDPMPGKYILTGSSNFSFLTSISQSLAGRTALLTLLPLTFEEQNTFVPQSRDLFDVMHTGSYPAIYDRKLTPNEWFQSYVTTYLERDVRNLLNVSDLYAFQTFLSLCAGHSSRLLNLSQLGADCGISHNTAKSWISVLEAGYIIHRQQPYYANINKRLVKTPKLHFVDTGLLCYLLGIRNSADLRYHPLRGAIFETWAVSEIMKHRFNTGETRSIFFYRDKGGLEADALIDTADGLAVVEMKSGQTVTPDQFKALLKVKSLVETAQLSGSVHAVLIYGGDARQKRSDMLVIPWRNLNEIRW